MADNKDKIARYVSGDMAEDEEVVFEAEMAEDEDLFLEVQLEQIRFYNIHRRVTAALESEELKKTSPLIGGKSFMPNVNSERGLGVVLKRIKTSGLQRLIAAAVLVGLAVGAVYFFQHFIINREEHKDSVMHESTQPEIKPSNENTTPMPEPAPFKSGFQKVNIASHPEQKIVLTLQSEKTFIPSGLLIQDTLTTGSITAGTLDHPTIPPNSFAQAYENYHTGRYADVHDFTAAHADDTRAIELEGYTLYREGKFKEAIPIFEKLSVVEGFEKKAEWMLLLCFARQYSTKQEEFLSLSCKIRSEGKHREDAVIDLIIQMQISSLDVAVTKCPVIDIRYLKTMDYPAII